MSLAKPIDTSEKKDLPIDSSLKKKEDEKKNANSQEKKTLDEKAIVTPPPIDEEEEQAKIELEEKQQEKKRVQLEELLAQEQRTLEEKVGNTQNQKNEQFYQAQPQNQLYSQAIQKPYQPMYHASEKKKSEQDVRLKALGEELKKDSLQLYKP